MVLVPVAKILVVQSPVVVISALPDTSIAPFASVYKPPLPLPEVALPETVAVTSVKVIFEFAPVAYTPLAAFPEVLITAVPACIAAPLAALIPSALSPPVVTERGLAAVLVNVMDELAPLA